MIPDEGERRILKARKDIGVQRVVLYKTSVALVAGTVWADLTECDFSGYARGIPTWGSIATGLDGRAVMLASAITFTHSGGATGNDVYGVALIDGTPGSEVILSIKAFDDVVAMNGIGDYITVTPSSHDRQQP